jgi:acetolactate synthase-1/2/3 large subunit
LKINLDLKYFLYSVNLHLINYKYSITKQWKSICQKWKLDYPNVNRLNYEQKKYVNPYCLFDKLSNKLNNKDIIVADTGANLTWAVQSFKIKVGQRFFSAYGNSPMGYALPAALGASLANKKKRIISIMGDAGLQINIQELQTAVANKIPVKIFVINNKGYGIIKQFQELYLKTRYEATTPSKGVTNPDFKKISNAYKINYSEINNNLKIDKILEKVLRSKKTEFVNVLVKPNQQIIPKLQFGNPIEDLSPILPRTEFKKNMVVKILKGRLSGFIEAN